MDTITIIIDSTKCKGKGRGYKGAKGREGGGKGNKKE